MKHLCVLLSLCALCVLAPGCATTSATRQPLIIGQRVLAPDPGQTITIPPLLPPARQWYLVDDIGLGAWLDIAPPPATIAVP
ncbi:MAG: hypothetical protein WCI17_12160 [bacterium]